MSITLLYASIESFSTQSECFAEEFQLEHETEPSKTRQAWKTVLRKYLNRLLPAIAYSLNGKPYFTDPELPNFNISHTHDTLLIALSSQGEIGCDIEQIRPRNQWQKLATEVFTDAELQWVEQQPAKLDAFWTVWVLKEAFLKLQSRTVWEMSQIEIPFTALEAKHPLMQFFIQNDQIVAICSTQPIVEVQIVDWR